MEQLWGAEGTPSSRFLLETSGRDHTLISLLPLDGLSMFSQADLCASRSELAGAWTQLPAIEGYQAYSHKAGPPHAGWTRGPAQDAMKTSQASQLLPVLACSGPPVPGLGAPNAKAPANLAQA